MDRPPIQANQVDNAPRQPQKYQKIYRVIAVLVLLVIALLAWYWLAKNRPLLNRPKVYNTLPKGYEFKALPQGQYPEGFPKELVLSVGQMEVIRAEDTMVASGQNQKIVDIRAADKPDSLAGLYRNTLTDPKQGWQLITSETTNNITALVFKKDTASLVVTIMPKDNGSQINLTYVAGK